MLHSRSLDNNTTLHPRSIDKTTKIIEEEPLNVRKKHNFKLNLQKAVGHPVEEEPKQK